MSDFTIFINFVVFENSKLHLLSLMFNLLGSRIGLLLLLLGTTTKTKNQMKRRLFLNVVIGKRATIF
jgi:hypothetical protein